MSDIYGNCEHGGVEKECRWCQEELREEELESLRAQLAAAEARVGELRAKNHAMAGERDKAQSEIARLKDYHAGAFKQVLEDRVNEVAATWEEAARVAEGERIYGHSERIPRSKQCHCPICETANDIAAALRARKGQP